MAEQAMPHSYEQAVAELQQIIQELEQQSVDLDELANKTARAKALMQFCESKLQGVEQQLDSEAS